jgi:uncharacterized membrane protein YtjA (UPF0391 family)
MLRWSAVFFVISIIAAMLGFTSIAGSALDIAKILFFIFLIPAIVLLICGLFVFGTKS